MNQNFSYQISDYDDLREWRESNVAEEPLNEFLCNICDLLGNDEPKKRVNKWIHSIQNLQRRSVQPFEDFLMAEQFLAKHNISFLDLSVEVATAAVLHELNDEFQQSAMNFADTTRLVAFRFLSAWTLLNSDKLTACIQECEKVEDDYSPILTLLGQARLEAHDPQNAIQALECAVDIDPNEVLAWFQLAKAYSVLDQEDDSWNCLIQCLRITPNNIEVAAFLAISAVKNPSLEKCELAWKELFPHFNQVNGDPFAVDLLFEMGSYLQDPEKLSELLTAVDWESFRQKKQANEKIAKYQKRLQELKADNIISLMN